MKTSVGRIVHYISPEHDQHIAAIITNVNAKSVDLCAFFPNTAHPMPLMDIKFDIMGNTVGCYHWPEKVD